MLFSIIIPTYNSEKTIRSCIDSILIQKFDDFEIVVINDGSTDNTPEVLEELSKQDNRIKVYNFDNSGVSIARQRGISLATGEYLLFVDSDDTISSELFQIVQKTISEFDHPDIIRYQSSLINDAIFKNHDRYNYFDESNCQLSGMESLRKWSIPNKKYAVYWLYAFKRTIFSNVLFMPNLRCYEDLALIPLLIASANKTVTINYIGYNYLCNNSDSLTNKKSKEAERSRALDFIKAYHYAIENFRKLPNVSVSDLAFFVEDFNWRLREKFNSLDDDLKTEFYDLFKL